MSALEIAARQQTIEPSCSDDAMKLKVIIIIY